MPAPLRFHRNRSPVFRVVKTQDAAEGLLYDQVFALVPAFRLLLAASAAGSSPLSSGLALPAALPARRHCGWRCARTSRCHHHAPGPSPAYTLVFLNFSLLAYHKEESRQGFLHQKNVLVRTYMYVTMPRAGMVDSFIPNILNPGRMPLPLCLIPSVDSCLRALRASCVPLCSRY